MVLCLSHSVLCPHCVCLNLLLLPNSVKNCYNLRVTWIEEVNILNRCTNTGSYRGSTLITKRSGLCVFIDLFYKLYSIFSFFSQTFSALSVSLVCMRESLIYSYLQTQAHSWIRINKTTTHFCGIRPDEVRTAGNAVELLNYTAMKIIKT